MRNSRLIDVSKYCNHHHVDPGFVETLNNFGLFKTETIKKAEYFPANHLPEFEKFVRLHHDLHVDKECLKAISDNLKKMESMQDKMVALESELAYYNDVNASQAIDM